MTMRRTYEIVKNGIECQQCLKTSYNKNDVANLYCGSCKMFHNEHDHLYEDLFNNAFVYDERHLYADSLEMHENLKAGKWRILCICLASDVVKLNKMTLWSYKDPLLLTHEIGESEALAFISQKAMTDVEIDFFKRWFETTLVFGSF